jgi:hypothetical protein
MEGVDELPGTRRGDLVGDMRHSIYAAYMGLPASPVDHIYRQNGQDWRSFPSTGDRQWLPRSGPFVRQSESRLGFVRQKFLRRKGIPGLRSDTDAQNYR